MMIIGINKFSYTRLLIAILMVSSSTLLFAKKLDDQSLSEQYDSVAKLTPIIISAVRQDAQQPIDEQNSTQSEMAAKLADVAKKNEIYSLIIQSFFSTRKLNKKVNGKWIEISSLSSGEKQKAVIDVAYKLIANQDKNKNLILSK